MIYWHDKFCGSDYTPILKKLFMVSIYICLNNFQQCSKCLCLSVCPSVCPFVCLSIMPGFLLPTFLIWKQLKKWNYYSCCPCKVGLNAININGDMASLPFYRKLSSLFYEISWFIQKLILVVKIKIFLFPFYFSYLLK